MSHEGSNPPSVLTLTPIGAISTPRLTKFDAPHQPERDRREESVIELFPPYQREALRDLEGFSHLWLLWWFDRNTTPLEPLPDAASQPIPQVHTWRPMVRPPRGDGKRRGVFATRSPHRPNPVGITVVPLLRIEEGRIFVGTNDLLDQTPILDIKPYLPECDSFPEAQIGWLASIDDREVYKISLEALASEQLQWLAERGVDPLARAERVLRSNPFPHRTRRIAPYGVTSDGERRYRMGCGPFRLYYSVRKQVVSIIHVGVGYSREYLYEQSSHTVSNREILRDFLLKWS